MYQKSVCIVYDKYYFNTIPDKQYATLQWERDINKNTFTHVKFFKN